MRVFALEGMRVGNQYPIDVMDMSECGYACLVRYKEHQQAQCA